MSLEKKIISSLTELITQLPPEKVEAEASLGLLDRYRQLIKILLEADREEPGQLLGGVEGEPQVLFDEIGKLVRRFYEQMKIIRSDIPQRLENLAQQDMEKAGQRLEYIVEMTENAANSTMDYAENLAAVLKEQEFADKEVQEKVAGVLEDKNLPPTVKESLESIQSTLLHRGESYAGNQQIITQILVAQSYQDLTGQIIQKIVDLLANLESELVNMISAFGHVEPDKAQAPETSGDGLDGPQLKSSDSKQTQGDVDNLLEALGF